MTLESVDAKLSEKTRQIDKMLDEKISELRIISKEIKKDLEKLERLRKAQKDSLVETQQKLEALEETRKSLVADMNSELIKSQSKVEEFLSDSQEKVGEIERRVNQTLELESNIVDSLVKDSSTKISAAGEEKKAEISKKIEKQLDSIEASRAAFEQHARQKLLEMEKILSELKKARK